jgi:hypothetical protein
MISNNAIRPFRAGAENGVPHDRSIVGATLVVAHDDVAMDDGAVVRAGDVSVNNHVPTDDGVIVGAGVVPAHGKMPAHDRATTRVAPAGCSYTGRDDCLSVATNLEGLVQ